MLDSISTPAWVRNGRMDILATNQMGRALYSLVHESPLSPPNTARFCFLDPRAVDFWPDWNQLASETVASLRTEAGRNPYDKALTDLIGELSTRSEEFRVRWAAHDVHQHRSGLKRIQHPVVGFMELSYEAMEMVTDEGLTVLVYGAEPGSVGAEGLALLSTWVATETSEVQAAAASLDS